MKKWVIEVDGNSHVCDLVRSYISTLELHLANKDGREFLIKFNDTDDFYDSKNGFKKPVYITNKSKTQYKHGFAVFKISK